MLDQLNFEAIRLARTAAARTRFVTTLIVIAAVLATLAYWNSKSDSWIRLRFERQYLLQEVNDLVADEVKRDSLDGYRRYLLLTRGVECPKGSQMSAIMDTAKSALARNSINGPMYDRIHEPRVDTNFIDMLSAVRPALYTPEKWMKLRTAVIGLKDWQKELAHAENFSDQLRAGYVETALLVNIPFFGPAFDVNDLSLFAGLVLSLMMIGLCYVIIREQHTVDTLGEIVKELDPSLPDAETIKRRIYQVTAHANVLTMPPIVAAQKPTSMGHVEFDRITRRIFFILGLMMRIYPLAIYFAIYLNDRNTREYGMTLSPGRLASLEFSSTVFLILLLLLSMLILVTNWRLELRWKDLARQVRI